MDLRQLRYFLAIVEEGSISRAAERVHVAQPALSLHVKRMEERLGTALLIRGAQGVVPTEAGTLLARRALVLLAEAERTEEELRSFGKAPTGKVRIGLPGTVSGILAVPLIAACRARHPGIGLVVAEAMSGFVRDWLTEGQVDLAVLYGDPSGEGIAATALLEEELAMLLPPGAVVPEPAGLEVLAAHPLILPSGPHGLRAMLDVELRRLGIAAVPAIELDSYAGIKQLVADGHGVSVLPRHAVAAEAAAGQVTVRALAPSLWRTAWLARSSTRPLTRAAETVAHLIEDTALGLIAAQRWQGARPL